MVFKFIKILIKIMEQGSRRSPRSLTPKANSPKMPASPMVTKKTKL
jgi:hypothetical protein